MKELYLDTNATTSIDKEVLEVMIKTMKDNWGNPSSNHARGKLAKSLLETSREKIASLLKVYPDEIIFTSGGTESNNLALQGISYAYPEKNHIISTTIEHSSVYNTLKFLNEFGSKDVSFIAPEQTGIINPKKIENAISKNTLVISVMYANNELGTIQPIDEIGRIAQKSHIFFHTDAVQAIGKIPIEIKKNNIALLSASGHKINGPMGTGFLYKRQDIDIVPLFHGGGQEHSLRSGTENVPGIVGLAKALELKINQLEQNQRILTELSQFFIFTIKKEIPNIKINGTELKRLPNTINVRFSPYAGLKIISYLSADKIFASPSSACSSHSDKPSRVLTEIGLFPDEAYSSVRFSFSTNTTKEDILYLIKKLKTILTKI